MPQPLSHPLRHLVKGLVAAAVIGSASLAQSQTAAPAPAPPTAATTNTLPLVSAEVRRVDARAGKITLKHADIPNLEMPPMTMVFVVEDPALVATLKPGDRVKFTADKRLGSYTVLSVQRDD